MTQKAKQFLKPTPIEQFFNKLIGILPDWGIGPQHMRILEVKGRKSGKTYRTPVNLMEVENKLYLVAPRGETQWVRNARHVGTVSLKRGKNRTRYRVTELVENQKAPLLKEYLERYKSEVQRYFSVPADSDVSAFTAIADQYPVLELEAITG